MTSLALGQSFTAVTTSPDFGTNEWTDTVQISRIWLNPDGMIDSAVVLDYLNGSLVINYYSEWSRAAYVPVGWFHTVPIEWKQFGAQGEIPKRTRSYQVKGTDTVRIADLIVGMVDSLLVSVSNLEGRNRTEPISTNYEYDDQGALERQLTITEEFGVLHETVNSALDRIYDSEGRVIEIRQPTASFKNVAIEDSQTFEYYNNNTLKRATQWRYSKGKLDSVLRYEFVSWQNYQPNDYWFGDEDLMAGGDDFKLCSFYVMKPGETEFKPSHTIERKYDSQGFLKSESRTAAGGGEWRLNTFEYYKNGDIRSISLTSSSNPDVSHLNAVYDNHYNSKGLLDSTVRTITNRRPERTVFYYPTQAKVDEQLPIESLALSSEGDHRVKIMNIAGQTLREYTSSIAHLEQADLPSGLYFISIDGGRPRKHVIP